MIEFINAYEAKHDEDLEEQRLYAEARVESLGMSNN